MLALEFVVISLPTSADRRKLVSHRLRQLRWPWRYFDAHTASENVLPYDPARALVRRGYKLSPAEIGCYSSHIQCLREHAGSAASSPEFMVVLEDDVLLDERFDFGALPTLMSQLDIHYLKLYSRFLTRFRYLGRIGQRGLYRFVVPPYGSQAYVISKVGARRLVSAAKRIERPIDDEMDRYWVNGLPTYVLFPFPVLESELGSTIAKGSAQLTLLQGIESRAFIWADKVPREYANLRLVLRDRITRDKVLGLAGLA